MMLFGGGMLLIWLLLLAVIIAGVGGVFNRSRQESGTVAQQPTPKSPQDILRDRYARGEISQEEYQQMQETLEL